MSDAKREEFQKWFRSKYPMSNLLVDDFNSHLWYAWQARGELEAKEQLATYQARVRELEEALRLAIKQNSCDMVLTGEEYRKCEKALSTTTPDTALQKAVLDARIETVEMIFEERINSSNFDTLGYYLNHILLELRAQLAALEGEVNG